MPTHSPRIPFYASYVQFVRLLELLKGKNIPPRLKSSVLTNLGINADDTGRLVGGLKAQNWIDEDYKPTTGLRALVEAYGTSTWPTVLREELVRSYPFVSGNWSELTPELLREAFVSHTRRDIGAVRSAETFFLTAAKEAGVHFSSAFAARTKRVPPNFEGGIHVDPPLPLLEKHQTNGRENSEQKSKLTALIFDLLELADDPFMNGKEKEAVLTLSAYLRRRAKEQA